MLNTKDQTERDPRAEPQVAASQLQYRLPVAEDGFAVHRLIERCPPLDPNSLYCNLLQTTHFADTAVLVECDGEVAAFLSAYVKPGEPEVLFVWQIAVAEKWRGHGLAQGMLKTLLQRPKLRAIQFLETSITPSNQASAKLFRRFAAEHQAALTTSVLFSKAAHFAGTHDDEVLFRIGPFGSDQHSSQ